MNGDNMVIFNCREPIEHDQRNVTLVSAVLQKPPWVASLSAVGLPQLRNHVRRELSRAGMDAQVDEEAMQDSLVAMARNRPTFAGPGALCSWVAKTSKNAARNRVRRRRPVANSPAIEAYAITECARQDRHRNARLSALGECFQKLSPTDRIVLHLRYWRGLPCEQVAELLGSTKGATATHCHRARKRLRALILEYES